ncbi:MAG: flagellar biosynthetic protein FliO, partial [Bdellovibrionota bacterium]
AEEKALLEKVMQSSAPAQAPEQVTRSASVIGLGDKNKQQPIGGLKPLASPSRALIKMVLVLGLFGVFAWILKKFILGKVRSAGALGALNRFARNKFGAQGKMIEVISSHYLGPKKSICVVKIAGRMMVLGITDESINLISNLASASHAVNFDDALGDDEVETSFIAAVTGAGAVSGGRAQFSDVLDREHGKPVYSADSIARSASKPPTLSSGNNIRAQIKNKMEGMKPL